MLNEVDPAVNRSTANGSTTVFPYTFLIYDQAEIEVLCDTTVKTLTTDYTVSGVGVSGGGNIEFVSAPTNGLIVTRMRKQPAAQQSDYIRNEAQPSERIEQDLDKLGMMVQQIKEVLRRCLTFKKSSSLANQAIDEPTEGLFARWKTGGGIDWATPTNASPASLPISIANGGTGATTAAAARTALLVYSENTLVDAKGDLLVGASDNTLARLAPPTTPGLVTTYDPSAANFISWGHRAQDNPIINGNMEVWQRGTTFAAPATATYGPDRFNQEFVTTGVFTINRSTNVPTVAQAGVLFNYSLEIDVTAADAAVAAGDVLLLKHSIEGYNWRHFAQRACIISFWVLSSKTGAHGFSVVNVGFDREYFTSFTINSADTWEYKTVAIPASPSAGTWDYTNGIGLRVNWTLMAGTNRQGTPTGAWSTPGAFVLHAPTTQVNVLDSTANFFRITGVKMELGSVATPIQFRSFQDELQLCKRYYEKSFDYAITPVQNAGTQTGEMLFQSTGVGSVFIRAPQFQLVPKRINSGTVVLFNPVAANAEIRNDTRAQDLNSSVSTANGENRFVIQGIGSAATAVGDICLVHWTYEVELF